MSTEKTDDIRRNQSEDTIDARKDNKEIDNIQDFAENTMNELLAWYGYDKLTGSGSLNVNRNKVGKTPADGEVGRTDRPRSGFPSEISSEHGRPPFLLESNEKGIVVQEERGGSSSWLDRQKVREISPSQSVGSTDSNGVFPRPSSVNNSPTSADSVESNVPTTGKTQSVEPDQFAMSRRLQAMTTTTAKLKTSISSSSTVSLCDWCKQVPTSVSFSDSVDGLNQLGFCSDSCLNHYKMNLFCTETQQHLQQIQSEDAKDVTSSTCSSSETKILITPDLWMAERKDRKRKRKDETSATELRRRKASTVNDDVDFRRRPSNIEVDDDDFPESFLTTTCVTTKQRNEEKVFTSSEISNETSSETTRHPTSRSSSSFDRVNKVVDNYVDERSSDVEIDRRGKRTTKTDGLNRMTIGGMSIDEDGLLSTVGKGPDRRVTPDGSRSRGGRATHLKASPDHLQRAELFHLPIKTSSLDAAVGRSSGFSRSNETEGLLSDVSFLGQNKLNPTPQFQTSPGFRFGTPGPGLFPTPGMSSVMHLLGPALNNPLFGGGAPPMNAPLPFPLLGFPPFFSLPGSVPPPPPPPQPPGIGLASSVGNPFSSLLPPNTLMIPYPVLLPLPIPIPIPIPLPAKSGGSPGQQGATDNSTTADNRGEDETEKSDAAFPRYPIHCACCHRNRNSSSSLKSNDPDQDHRQYVAMRSPSLMSDGGIGYGIGDNHPSSNRSDIGSDPSSFLLLHQNVAIDFSKSRETRGEVNSPSTSNTTPLTKDTSTKIAVPSILIKSEPLEMLNLSNNNKQLSSRSSSSSSSFVVPSCELPSLPSLPYLARRSLILDAPSVVSKEKSLEGSRTFTEGLSSKRFANCKRRCPVVHVQTK